ncbi:MAG: lipid-binding SYLF domain-containing protein [Simkaniaceae bacterium]
MRKNFLISLLLSFQFYLFGSEMQNDIDKATMIIREFKSIPERGIPAEILRNAQGLAILSVVKAGFIFSGKIGSGIVIARNPDGWSAPSAIGTGGAGWGLQIGAEVTDFVLVLNTRSAVEAFASGGSLTLGGNVSVAAGPVGRTAEAGIGVPFAAVYSYSRSQGLFVGVSLEGAVLVEREGVNRDFYGRYVSARELLSGQVLPPKSARALYKELNSF